MYSIIDSWLSSGQSQYKISKELGMSRNTFKYWLDKYRKEMGNDHISKETFIPVHVSTMPKAVFQEVGSGMITIAYPNGIKVSCPMDISLQQLRGLIKL